MRKVALIFSLVVAFCSYASDIVTPPSIKKGDKIGFITPSSASADAPIKKAFEKIRRMGFEPVAMPHAFGSAWGSYAATDSVKVSDIEMAFADPEIKAIICTRGGYGSARLLDMLPGEVIRNNPKWLVGFSDISAMHAYMYHNGVASIHGPMTAHIANEADNDAAVQHLFAILTNGLPYTYNIKSHKYNRPGHATGRLLGGNYIVVNNLAETPWDVFNVDEPDGVIIYVEEVGEKIYAVERMLLRMHQAGVLDRVNGLIFGQFTDYKGDLDFATMEDMIYHWLKEWGYYDKTPETFPIVYNFPVGHCTNNYPIVQGAMGTLSVTSEEVTLTME